MAADGVDIGTLSGRITFEDQTSKTLDLILGRIDQLDSKVVGLDKGVGAMSTTVLGGAAAFAALSAGVALTATTLADMAIEGAAMGDIVDNFEHMTSSAGRLSSTLLGALKEGTHNTIDDLTLIGFANKDLAAGLNLTDEQFRTMAKGAFALAQATGGSVKDGLDAVNDALLTGQTRSVKRLTGQIESARAEEELAKKLGVTVDRLSEEGKLEAKRTAILEAIGAATTRLGEQTEGLDERADQAKASLKNMYDEMAIGIGTSPAVSAAFGAIEGAILKAFGDNRAALIENVVGAVESFADGVAKYGPPIIEFFVDLASKFKPLTDFIGGKMREMQDGVQGLALLVQGYSVSEAEAMIATTKLTDEMVAQDRATKKASEAAKAHADALAAVERGADKNNDVVKRGNLILEQTREELKKQLDAQKELASATGDYNEIVDALDQSMVNAIKTYLQAGVSQGTLATAYGLTATQMTAVTKQLKDETEALKLEEKQIIDSQERWAQFNAQRVEMSGTATDKLIAQINSWRAAQIKSHQSAKTDTADFYAWLDATTKQSYEQADTQRLEADTHSKAYYERLKMDAQDAFEFAIAHADQFTSEYIEGLRRTKDAASDAAQHWRREIGGSLTTFLEQARALSDAMGFTTEVNSSNFLQALRGASHQYSGATGVRLNDAFDVGDGRRATDLAKQGYSMEEIVRILTGGSTIPGPPKGPRIPGFAEGGVGDFGHGTLALLHGREAIVPLDRAGGIGGHIYNTFHVNGTAQDTARQIGVVLIDQLKARRYLPTAG